MSSRRCHRLITAGAVLALVFASTAGPQALPGRKSGKDKETEPHGPAVRLTVSPRHGFRPLTVTLTATLSGVERNDPEYCHPGAEWESRTPSGLTVTSKEDPRCLHPPEQVDVQYTFTKVVTLTQPGVFSYRFILHRRDGSKLMSIAQEVRVIDAG